MCKNTYRGDFLVTTKRRDFMNSKKGLEGKYNPKEFEEKLYQR